MNAAYDQRPRVGKDYIAIIGIFIVLLATVVPVGMIGVYFFDVERKYMAYLNFWVFDISMYGMMITPWLPLKSLQKFTNWHRLTLMVQTWMVTYTITAFTYEVPWVLFWETIAKHPDAVWTYMWTVYVEGGDIRYANPSFFVLAAETSACIVAFITLAALYVWFKSGQTSTKAVYALMLCAALHMWPTIYYYTDEILHGFPHVDTEVISNFYGKFILSNSLWLWMPAVVWYWGTQTLPRLYKAQP